LIVVRFYNHWSSKTRVLEVCTVVGVESGGHSSAPVEKKDRSPGAHVMIRGSPGMHWKRQFPLLGVHLGKGA